MGVLTLTISVQKTQEFYLLYFLNLYALCQNKTDTVVLNEGIAEPISKPCKQPHASNFFFIWIVPNFRARLLVNSITPGVGTFLKRQRPA